MLELRPERGLLTLYADGLLTTRDYVDFVAEFERLVRSEIKPVAMLIELGPGFAGWNVGALWQGVQPDVLPAETFSRIAVVGDVKWQEWFAAAANLMVLAGTGFFEKSERADAENWVRHGCADGSNT